MYLFSFKRSVQLLIVVGLDWCCSVLTCL